MLICRYCQTTVCDSTTKTCPKCGTVNALVYNGGMIKPEKDSIITKEELDRMMAIDPNADPYGPKGILRSLHVGSSPEFRPIVDGVEVRQIAGVVSHVTGIGWQKDLDLGLALLMEAQE